MRDALLAREGLDSRSALQCADIIVGDAASMATAVRWIETTFRAYPGCAVVAACHEHGRWAIFATRNGRISLSWQSVGLMAHAMYDELVKP